MVDEPSIPGHGYCSGLVVDSMATGWEVLLPFNLLARLLPPNPTEEAGSTPPKSSLHRVSIRFLGPIYYPMYIIVHLCILLCKCEGHEASPALHATCRTLRVKVQVQQDANICVWGRTVNTVNTAPPNIPKQSRCHLFYEKNNRLVHKCLQLWP